MVKGKACHSDSQWQTNVSGGGGGGEIEKTKGEPQEEIKNSEKRRNESETPERTRDTEDCGVRAGRHLVVVGAAVSRRRLFGGGWTVGVHPSAPSCLPHVAVVIVQSHASFIHIHFLVQLNIWTRGVVALRGQKASVKTARTQRRSKCSDVFWLTSSPMLENCLLMGLIQESPQVFSGPCRHIQRKEYVLSMVIFQIVEEEK